MASEEPWSLTASVAADMIRKRQITSETLVAACLQRIEAREPDIRAWAHLGPELALRQARTADRQLGSGAVVGALHGVPIGIKDVIDTADMPTENGSVIFQGRRPEADAACVAALRRAGAIIIGKTVTTELASLTPAMTRNPRDPAHTPGGSSAGSAAAVADRMVPLALGTQTAGSVIRPASFCGVYAMKPTFGIVPRAGVTMQSHTLDTVGAFARSLLDLALVVACMSAVDATGGGPFGAILQQQPAATPRFGFWPTPAWPVAEESTRRVFDALAARLGAACETLELPAGLDAVVEAQRCAQFAENAFWYGSLLDNERSGLSDAMAERLERGAAIAVRDYLAAVTGREQMYAELYRILERYDAIICPAAPGPAPRDLATTGDPAFNGLWTFLGMPCVTLPLLEAEGMPLGVQIVGARGKDGELLRTAQWLERRLVQTP